MVIVFHLSLERSSLLPGSQLQCTLRLLNADVDSVKRVGPYHLSELFTNHKQLDDDDNNDNNNHDVDDDDGDDHGGILSWLWPNSHHHQTGGSQMDQEDVWHVDNAYAQIYGMCIGDSSWLNAIVRRSDDGTSAGAERQQQQQHQRSTYNDASTEHDTMETLVPQKRNFQTIFVSRPREIPQYRERSSALQIGHTECLQFSVQLPQSSCLPPSYKGRVLRYAYFVAVCVTVRNAHSGAIVRKVVRMPFRIHNPLACLSPIFSKFDKPFNFRWQFHQEHLEACVQRDSDVNYEDEQCEAMGKPSALDIIQQIKVQQKRKAMKHYSLHNVFADIERIIQSGMSAPKHFDISRGDNLVCRLSMFNTSFQIGDTVGCTFDFSNATIHCMEISCSLVYEEILAKWLSKDTHSERSNDGYIAEAGADRYHSGGKITRTSVAYFKEHVLHNMFTSFNLMIPPHAPAQFSTDLVQVKYFLRFTFRLLIDRKRDSMPSTMRKELQSPSTSSTAPLNADSRPIKKSMEGISSTTQPPLTPTALGSEELEWSLPISVFVPNSFRPLHVQSHSREMYSSLM